MKLVHVQCKSIQWKTFVRRSRSGGDLACIFGAAKDCVVVGNVFRHRELAIL